MPYISNYKCDTCDFTLPTGWGGHVYVTNAAGKRIACPHPGEMRVINQVIGEIYPELTAAYEARHKALGYGLMAELKYTLAYLFRRRAPVDVEMDRIKEEHTGFNSYCVCCDCLHQFALDVKRDDRICPVCHSCRVVSVRESVGKPCPQCRTGKIECLPTGAIA